MANDDIVTIKELQIELEKFENRLLQKVATKDELNNLATKDELKNLATKDELKNLATKDELKNLATKDEIKTLVTREEFQSRFDILATEILNLHNKIDSVDQKHEKSFDQLVHIMEAMSGKIDLLLTEKAATDYGMDRHEKILDNHETRLNILEKTVA